MCPPENSLPKCSHSTLPTKEEDTTLERLSGTLYTKDSRYQPFDEDYLPEDESFGNNSGNNGGCGSPSTLGLESRKIMMLWRKRGE